METSLKDGTACTIIAGTITLRLGDGDRVKTLAKNVVAAGGQPT